MASVVHVECGCGATVNVFPLALSTLLESVVPEAQARNQLLSQLSGLEDESDERFAVADESGRFSCPACGSTGYAPQIDLN